MDNRTVLDKLASRFRALGAEKRLRILASLSGGERCACDLTGCCGDRQPLLSFHLKTLREAGLVRARREGRWMYYDVDRDALRDLGEQLIRIGESDAREGDCCGASGDGDSDRPVERAVSGQTKQRSTQGGR
jgi:ArsR family transcriptional regulator